MKIENFELIKILMGRKDLEFGTGMGVQLPNSEDEHINLILMGDFPYITVDDPKSSDEVGQATAINFHNLYPTRSNEPDSGNTWSMKEIVYWAGIVYDSEICQYHLDSPMKIYTPEDEEYQYIMRCFAVYSL